MAWVRRDGEKAEFQATARLSSKPHWGHIFSGVTYQPTNPITKVSNNNNCSHQDSTESLADRAVFSHVERAPHRPYQRYLRRLFPPIEFTAERDGAILLSPNESISIRKNFLSEKTFNQKNSTSITCIDFGFSKNPTESARVLWYPLSFTYVTVARVWFKITWELSI